MRQFGGLQKKRRMGDDHTIRKVQERGILTGVTSKKRIV
jgi:hypothetical protein